MASDPSSPEATPLADDASPDGLDPAAFSTGAPGAATDDPPGSTTDDDVAEVAAAVLGYLGRLGFLLAAVGALGVGSSFALLLPVTWYNLQTELGLMMVVPLGLVVWTELWVLGKLQAHPDPVVRRTGIVAGLVFQYTALAQGLLMTVTVLWIGAVIVGYDTAPTAATFPEDFIIGTGYASCFIYGAVGGTCLIGTEVWARWVGGLYGAATIALPIVATTVYGDELREAIASDGSRALALAVLYFLVAGVIGMLIITPPQRSRPGAPGSGGPAAGQVDGQADGQAGAQPDAASTTGPTTGSAAGSADPGAAPQPAPG